MKLEDLQQRISRLSRLLSDPEPGLSTWHQAVEFHTNELTELWNASEVKTLVPQVSNQND